MSLPLPPEHQNPARDPLLCQRANPDGVYRSFQRRLCKQNDEMINALELRIRNYVKTDNEEVLTVKAILENDCCLLQISNIKQIIVMNTLINPIELTEEWLIKLSLINSSHAGLKRYSHPDCDFELGEYKGEWFLVDREMQLTVKVKYVHKAQNLCYELHNLELTTKETAQ